MRVLLTHELPGGHGRLAGHDVVRGPATPETVGDVDAIVCLLTVTVDEPLLAAAPRLRVVANVAVGVDNVDVAAATARGVVVTNTPDVLTETTADLAFGLVIAAARRMSEAEADLRAGRWAGWEIGGYLGVDVHGATLGIVGYGRIGRAVARRAAGFGMEVLHTPDTPLPELLARSDAVTLHVPGTRETRHLVGRDELASMKPTAVLVNTSRGSVVDEDALADALESGTIRAAGLDVHADEPAVHPRLLARRDVVLLPHIGSASVATRTRMAEVALGSAASVLAGGLPRTAVNPEARAERR